MLTLYGAPRTRSTRVSWLLEELSLPWQYHYINFAKGDNQQPAFLTLNPSGKIPVLTDIDTPSGTKIVISESVAICHYLVEKYNIDSNTPLLLPKKGTAESAHYHQWISFISCELEQALWTMAKHKFALPKSIRQDNMPAVAIWEFDKSIKVAEKWLPDTPFLLGNDLSIADILFTHTLMWATKSELEIPLSLAKYRDRLMTRDALANATEKESAASRAA